MSRLYGKITNGKTEFAPNILVCGDTQVINPTEEMYLSAGYKVIEIKNQTDNENNANYTDVGECILMN